MVVCVCSLAGTKACENCPSNGGGIKGRIVSVTGQQLSNNDVQIELARLRNRVEKLEKEKENEKDEELRWALDQFKYMSKDEAQTKAFRILQESLGYKYS